MKSGKKPLTKNLLYSGYALTDEDEFDTPFDPRKEGKPVRKMRDRNEPKGFKGRKSF